MQPPNLFAFATSELSQDAFICWLASWADPALKDANSALHDTAQKFIVRLLEFGKGPQVADFRSIQARRQWKDIDVLLVVNSDTAIIIEDKTDTKDHSGQLQRYREAIADEFPASRIAAVYFKTGDQGNYRSAQSAGYGCFLRKHFLAVLDQGERAGVRNDIFADFLRHLRAVEAAVQSFTTIPLGKWNEDRRLWAGFFLVLQDRLGEGDWRYVANPSGGFMGFWWHWLNDKYLQLEYDKLCFRIEVPEKTQRTAKWLEWHKTLMTQNGTNGVKIEKPTRRAGQFMTVAVLEGNYRQSDAGGLLHLDRTVEMLRNAEALMDAALSTIPSGVRSFE